MPKNFSKSYNITLFIYQDTVKLSTAETIE